MTLRSRPVTGGAPTILNLGCGTKTSAAAINIDWSIYLRLHRSKIGHLLAPLWLSPARREAFRQISGTVVVHDLSRGIPAASGIVDAVYHCHVLEHIDRPAVPAFMAEVLRVLKPGGVHRIVLPDFVAHIRNYVESLELELPDHDLAMAPLLEQSVAKEAYGTSLQGSIRRRVENMLLGDARKRGQTHQWAYDPVNLRQILEASGFVNFEVVEPNESSIPGWAETGLETNADGTVYKDGSLRVEARKPS
jgi:SAM-dependent methyltransferase